MADLWTEKFFPQNEDEFVGNSDIVEKALEWAKSWDAAQNQPPLLLWGQSGSGKTALAYLIAKKFGWDIVELNSSDLRSKDVIEKIVGAACQNASFFGKKRLILIDEVDAMTRVDRGGAGAIAGVIKQAQNPIILTATDIFVNKGVSSLRFVCKAFEFKKINYLSMAKRLQEILTLQKIEFEPDAIKELAKNSVGDMRSALLDLQTLSYSEKITMSDVQSLSSRGRQQKIFSVMKSIFKGTDFTEIRSMRSQTDLDHEMLFMWVDENIPRQYSHADIPAAFDTLSRADIFNGRIYRRQHWGFLRYSTELASEGVALSKEKVSHDFVMYQFPALMSLLSKTSSARAMRKELGSKFGKITHSSSRKIISADLPFIKEIFRNDSEYAVQLCALVGLDEKELAFLLDTSAETKKVQGILSQALELKEKSAKPKHVFEHSLDLLEIDKSSLQQEKKDGDQDHKSNQTKLF